MGAGTRGIRVADRTLRVFERALHPEWFSVRAHERFSLGHWEADVRIVEGGHVIVFGGGETRVAEVFGGPETVLPPQGMLLNAPVRRERSVVLHPGGRIVYQACLEVERVDPEVFRHLCEEMIFDARGGRLFHAFPSANRMRPGALSHIRVDRLAAGASIQTFHSFPEDLAVFRSQTLIEIAALR